MSYKKFPTTFEIQTLIRNYNEATDALEKKRILKETHFRLSFIYHDVIRKYSKYPNFEDIHQSARAALINAIVTFDYKKCNNYYLWMSGWVKKSVAIQALREKERLALALRTQTIEEVEEELFAKDDIENEYGRKQQYELINSLVNCMGKKHQTILRHRFGLDSQERSLRESADMLGLPLKKTVMLQTEAINAFELLYKNYVK